MSFFPDLLSIDQPTCAVTVVVYDDDGSRCPDAIVTATLDRWDMYGGYIAPLMVEGITDQMGETVLVLWPNSYGSTESFYKIKIVTPQGKTLKLTCVVPETPNEYLHDIAQLPVYPGKPDQPIRGAVGPQGERGPAGPVGPVGPQGPKGEDSYVPGPSGNTGSQGPVGPAGPQGAVGPIGPQGIQGVAGPIGPVGPIGPQGPVGADSTVPGPQGPQGPAGIQGPIGPKGDAGPTGPQGQTGLTGAPGPQGIQGEVGPVGPKGETGDDALAVIIVGGFGAQRFPDALPPDGYIPEDWDSLGWPPIYYQMKIGEGLIYNLCESWVPGYGDVWLYVSTASDPAGWINIGPIQGAPGTPGEQGPTGPQGPGGEIGPQGPAGADGARTLVELDDVEITAPIDKQVLVYDAATAKWINGAGGAGGANNEIVPSAVVSYEYISVNGQTVFGGADINGNVLAYPIASVIVVVNGATLSPIYDFDASNGTSIELMRVTRAGDEVHIMVVERVAGEQGPAGNAGADGEQGPQGEQGPIGPVGPQGVIGPQGEVGPPGPNAVSADPDNAATISLNDGLIYVPNVGGGSASLTVSDVPPVGAPDGAMWFNSSNLGLYVLYNDGTSSQWVQTTSAPGAATMYASETPPTDPTTNQLWFNSQSASMFVYYVDSTGGQWVEIVSIGAAPEITKLQAEIADLKQQVAGLVALIQK